MSSQIHSSSIIEKGAIIGNDVQIGPFCIVGKDVKIGDGTILKSHVVIEGSTEIGKNNLIYQFTSIGINPQDLKFTGENAKTIIGDNNTIRESVTIHKGTSTGIMKTAIGNNCLLMAYSHVAHDCLIGNNVILANGVTLAGHVEVDDYVVIGGLSAVHQFVKIGKGAMIGGMSGVEKNVIPYATIMGERAKMAGLNLIGLKRQNISKDEIHQLRKFYKQVFENDLERNLDEKIDQSLVEFKNSKLVSVVINFIQEQKSRGICQTK